MTSHCRKCKGLMVEEWLSDALDESYVSKCVNCGAVTDAMIEANRRAACERQAVKAHHQR